MYNLRHLTPPDGIPLMLLRVKNAPTTSSWICNLNVDHLGVMLSSKIILVTLDCQKLRFAVPSFKLNFKSSRMLKFNDQCFT